MTTELLSIEHDALHPANASLNSAMTPQEYECVQPIAPTAQRFTNNSPSTSFGIFAPSRAASVPASLSQVGFDQHLGHRALATMNEQHLGPQPVQHSRTFSAVAPQASTLAIRSERLSDGEQY
jgi:hypothetical protein